MASAATHQDMPPPGGFKPLDYSRIPARTYFGGKTIILANIALTAGSLYLYSLAHRKIEREKIENRGSQLAVTPLLKAERDREFLKQLRRNRDEEAALMANVEGWEVGKWRGESIYKSLGEDAIIHPTVEEYFVHTQPKNLKTDENRYLWD